MGRPKKAANPAAVEAEVALLELKPSVSKAEAVRRALAAGSESPEQGVAYLLDNFGIVMDRQTFSANKSQEKARDAKKAEASRKSKPGRKPKAVVESHTAPVVKHRSNGESDLVGSLETLKPLIAQYGPDKVKRLVDLLG
jgi:hypothetical protein